MAVIIIEEPRRRKAGPPPGIALFSLGLRPFYLLAAALAATLIPLWLLLITGWLRLEPALQALIWHGHEMIFGFAAAVIVGFLFTAVGNWTGQRMPRGKPLAALALLWLAARVAMLCGPHWLAAVLDLAFLPLAALAIAPALWRARQRRNYFLPLMLLLLTSANALVHAAVAGWLAVSPLLGLHLAVALVTMLETVIAGRIVPGFTASGGRAVVWRDARVESAALALTGGALLAWALDASAALCAALALPAALAQIVRCQGWRPQASLGKPLLWSLHLAHAWIIVALLLLAASPWWPAAHSAVLHVLTVGAMAGLILAMITRTALGHTGRMLRVDWLEATAYGALVLAVLARVLPVLLWPAAYISGLWIAALVWSFAFLLYLWRYVPILVGAAADRR